MTATLPNRIAGHFAPDLPPVPEERAERESLYQRAVLGAVAFLAGRLRHPDAAVAERAALVLIDLEKTRLRHGRKIAGTAENPCDAFDHPLSSIAPIAGDFDPDADEVEDDDEFVDEDDEDEEEVNEETVETDASGARLPPGCRMIAGHIWTPEMLRQLDTTMGQYCEARDANEKRLRELAACPESGAGFHDESHDRESDFATRPRELASELTVN